MIQQREFFTHLQKLFLSEPIIICTYAAQQAIQLDSSKIEYYDLPSDIYTYGNQKESAIKTLEKAFLVDSSNLDMNYKLARLYEQDKPNQAIKIYNRILSRDWSGLDSFKQSRRTL
ncbi:MAG: hypothetical protein MZV64_69165 [Ignavibacteriales bacterium]|nr:hypothetical protein [Ignavibacteriales bacterium]